MIIDFLAFALFVAVYFLYLTFRALGMQILCYTLFAVFGVWALMWIIGYVDAALERRRERKLK